MKIQNLVPKAQKIEFFPSLWF